MTTPMLQYAALFDGKGEFFGFELTRESAVVLPVVLPVFRISVSICCAKRRATSFTRALEGDRLVHHFPRFRPHIFLRAKRCIDKSCRRSRVPAENRRNGEKSCVWMHADF